ncbi:MAG: ABC transporter substrate-binding protein [Nitrososphaerales archaeon]
MNKKKFALGIGFLVAIVFALSIGYLAFLKYGQTDNLIPLIIIDDLGQSINITKTPQRIVSISASCTEILYALGCGDKIVAVDKTSDYPPEVKDKPCVGPASNLNVELIVNLDPDIVFAWGGSEKAINRLKELNITVVAIYPRSISGIMDDIGLIGKIMNKEAEASNLISEMQNRLDTIKGKLSNLTVGEKPLVYYELYRLGSTAGPGTVSDEMISLAGGINIAANQTIQYPTLSSEYIISMNPDVIIVLSGYTSIDEIKSRSGWQSINAVKNDRIYQIDKGLTSFTPRIVLGIEQMARWFHPDLFE